MSAIENTIKATLSDFWDNRSIPADYAGAMTIEDLVDPLESITAVDILSTLDIIVGDKIPTKVIQSGGYKSKEEFVNNLTSAVIDWVENK